MIRQKHILPDSEDSSARLKLSKYSLLTWIYFFFNSVLLPKGLLYTHIISPVFFYRAWKSGGRTWLLPFAAVLGLYDLAHLWIGVDLRSFLVSNVLFVLTYFCVVGFYHLINHYASLGRLIKEVLLINGILVLIAIPFFFMPRVYQEWFWYFNKLTKGVADFPRLALFTYEASYYSLLLVPVLYYYVCKFFFGRFEVGKWGALLLAVLPVLLSFSFGVIGATGLTALLMCLIFSRQLFRSRRSFAIFVSSLLVVLGLLVALFLIAPDNFVAVRLKNIANGSDTSTRGRTVESFAAAWRIAGEKSIWLGAGLGQIKIVIVDIAHKYYNYWGALGRYDIPNAMGETLAIFGVTGVLLRLLVQVFLFFRTRVYDNYYRLALFIFIFIYQFTGSFITNVVEYLVWVLAFSPVFPQFNVAGADKPKTFVS